MPIDLTVNGRPCVYEGDADMPLLWFLREELLLTGTKYGCGIGSCGACTVHVNGAATRACVVAMGDLSAARIVTIEGLPADGRLHPVQQAWIEEDAPQCGFCQAGQIMAVVDLLANNPDASDAEVEAQLTNLCRCGAYLRIRRGVRRAAELMRASR
ncbi:MULTISPECIES: (2Fe-2S)-binding protein [unclassified Phenylobacterium]|uniref:(2Fe-2S)-binding protein n=1 Tax=unclassified Phenylobacterium TaxID=2640670 RepID=UPI000AA0F307|nr:MULTISPECIES: (2Fe-2S)-binding protein [unclassified Phenylobacterium]